MTSSGTHFTHMRLFAPLACFIGIFSSFAPRGRAQTSASLQIETLSASPSAQQVTLAKQNLQNGQVVLMQGGDVALFNGLLGVGLIQDDPKLSTSSSNTVQMIAARISSTGSLHGYECYAEPLQGSSPGEGNTCESAFQAWADEEQNPTAAGVPEPLPGPWTELGVPQDVR